MHHVFTAQHTYVIDFSWRCEANLLKNLFYIFCCLPNSVKCTEFITRTIFWINGKLNWKTHILWKECWNAIDYLLVIMNYQIFSNSLQTIGIHDTGHALQNKICINTVYPKKYAHGFCFAVLCCGYTLTDFPISIRLTSLALWQSNDCPSASKATLMNMDKYFIWIHYERLHNHNKAKHNKTMCIFIIL